MGRGAGNCPLELLLFYLNNPKHSIEPIELTEYFVKLRYDLLWGYHMPYAITGYLNLHPRSAIEQITSENRAEVVELYQKLASRLALKKPISGLPEPSLSYREDRFGGFMKKTQKAIGLGAALPIVSLVTLLGLYPTRIS